MLSLVLCHFVWSYYIHKDIVNALTIINLQHTGYTAWFEEQQNRQVT